MEHSEELLKFIVKKIKIRIILVSFIWAVEYFYTK